MASLLSNPSTLIIPVLSLLSLLKATAGDIELAGAVFRLHFRGALCPLYTNETRRVRSEIMCAVYAVTRGASTFSFCASEDENCAISVPTYPLGAWNTSQPHCSLYSTLLPVPPIIPQPPGTKRYVLSSTKAHRGEPWFLESQNFCAADGYQFAVTSSAAEAQQFMEQLRTAFATTGCNNDCSAWLFMLPTLHWHDGSHLNLCEIQYPLLSAEPWDCFLVDYNVINIYKFPCDAQFSYSCHVACQTFE